VVLPWSTWAMIAMLRRILDGVGMVAGRSGCAAPWETPVARRKTVDYSLETAPS